MSQDSKEYKPIKLNSDIDPKYLTPEEGFYILNQQTNGKGKTRPMFGNEIMDEIVQPAGNNLCLGTHYSKTTNEAYSLHWNSLGHHFISRINAAGVDIIYQGPLNLSADPAHAMSQFRGYLIVQPEKNGKDGIFGKYFIWTTGIGDIGFLDVELSLYTDSFNIQALQKCLFKATDLITLEVRQPQRCIIAEVKESINQAMSNLIIDRAFQFRYKHIYYDGRSSEWSPISSLYYFDRPQFAGDSNFSRCFNLTVPSGSAFVEKIVIAYRTDNSNNWSETAIVDKYGDYPDPVPDTPMWYQREIILPEYDEDDCSFTYEFCADKECNPIDPEETARLYNPIPRDVQAILPIDNRLGFYNGKLNEDPLSKAEKKKVSFDIERINSDCIPETVTIKISAQIRNFERLHSFLEDGSFIYRKNGKTIDEADNDEDVAYFGGVRGSSLLHEDLVSRSEQSFKGKVRNFIAYVAGTDYWCEMKQYRIKGNGEMEEVGTLAHIGDKNTRNSELASGNQYVQMGEIKVPKGTRGFIRLASNHAEGNDQTGSTFVAGLFPLLPNYRLRPDLSRDNIGTTKEIFFDACGNEKVIDLTLTKSFVIADCSTARYHVFGYIRDKNAVPIEFAHVNLLADSSNTVAEVDSDHNGFYFYAGTGNRHSASIEMEGPTGFIQRYSIPKDISGSYSSANHDITIEDEEYANEKYLHEVSVKVEDCTGQPISGINISISGSRGAKTGSDGIAKISVRNVKQKNRSVRIVVMHTGGYLFRDCSGNCNPCMYTNVALLPASFATISTTFMGTAQYRLLSLTEKGLKSGGRYEFGLTMIGHGRRSFVQINDWFVDMPSIQAKQNYDLYGVKMTISSQLVFQPWVEFVSVSRTRNLNFDNYLEWIVDKIEYIDSAGNPSNKLAGTSIRLTVQSLNDYNASYFFRTNTALQYTAGDRVEFISNGDGTIYKEMISLAVKSPHYERAIDKEHQEKEPPADFFNQIIVENDSRLGDLKEGALIELQKFKQCEVKDRFQEICSPIPVGAFRGTISLATFDTYRINRTIPDQTTFFSFEHHSITDFWGTKLDDAGRLSTDNPYEREQRFGRDFWLVDVWSTLGNYIGTHTFRDSQRKRFAGVEMGDLIGATIRNARILFFICEHGHFLASIADDIPRLGKDGNLHVNNSESFVSDPQEGGEYGCSYEDVGSIFFGKGFATWFDTRRDIPGYIFSSYQQTKDISEGKMQRWFQGIANKVRVHNATAAAYDKFRFCSGLNTWNNGVMLTVTRPGLKGVNTEHEAKGDNQTICFDPASGDFTSYASCTPEAWGEFNDGTEKNTFVAFYRGQPWLHSSDNPRNIFFGVACDRVIGFAVNDLPKKEKKALAIEVQSDMRYFVSKVTTDNPSFISEIPAVNFKHKLNKWNAQFLRNTNSRGGLYKGGPAQGYFIAITLVRDNTDNLKYNTKDPVKQQADDRLDLIIVKYVLVESSGLTNK